ncbi:MAG TPA: exodeoxyribonuclease III [Spirochaetota bacterium]|nr:exodeoxyribonuclease III [Spirochaetota bacterium]
MKLISWNVNGIRAVIGKGFHDFVKAHNPDVLCLQETKATPDQVNLELPGYDYHYWNSAEKKGYSGTAVFSKKEPAAVTNGIGIDEHDHEGRVITADFGDYWLVNVYVPNSQRGLERLPYRHDRWDVDFLKYLKKLEKKKPVIFCGDLNVAHKEIDLANPKSNVKNAGFTPEERAGFDNIVSAGFVDTFREFTKEGGHYSWWSYMGRAREKNVGWRIDYFCVSGAFMPRVKKSYILPDIMGSDHAPVVLEIN